MGSLALGTMEESLSGGALFNIVRKFDFNDFKDSTESNKSISLGAKMKVPTLINSCFYVKTDWAGTGLSAFKFDILNKSFTAATDISLSTVAGKVTRITDTFESALSVSFTADESDVELKIKATADPGKNLSYLNKGDLTLVLCIYDLDAVINFPAYKDLARPNQLLKKGDTAS